jgi:hypothetical protein
MSEFGITKHVSDMSYHMTGSFCFNNIDIQNRLESPRFERPK